LVRSVKLSREVGELNRKASSGEVRRSTRGTFVKISFAVAHVFMPAAAKR